MTWMLTDWFIVGTLLLITVVDIVLVVTNTPTISNRFRLYARKISFFPYSWGVLAGHFWGPSLDPIANNWWVSIGCLVGCGGLVTAIHIMMLELIDPPDWLPLIYVPLGIAPGIFFWPQ